MGVEKRIWVAALMFVGFLTALEWLALGVGLNQFASGLSKQDDPFVIAVAILYLAVAFYLFFLFVLATLASKWPFQVASVVIFVFATFAEFSYARAIGRFTTYYDVVSAVGITSQQAGDSLISYINLLALVPCFVLIGLCVFCRNTTVQMRGPRWLALIFLSLGVFHFHLYYVNLALFDSQFASNSFGRFWQTAADLIIVDPWGSIAAKERETVESPISDRGPHPDNNVIFIFDESVQGRHLSLNGYSRPTTPYLETLAKSGVMKNFGLAVSVSTVSRSSFDGMIVGATPNMLDEKNFSEISRMPTIFQYARAMNYKTHMIDGQMTEYWAGIPDDLNYISDLVTVDKIDAQIGEGSDAKQWEIDRKTADIVKKIFSESAGNFVFIYKRGTHSPYDRNYPVSEAPWQPIYHFDDPFGIAPADRYQAIVNSYDNNLEFNLDDFFKRLADDYSSLPNNTVIIYTSDHGEVFSREGRASHGGSTPDEATVPLFIFGLRENQVDTTFNAAHANIFSTMLDLMKYPRDLRKYPYGISLFDATGKDQAPRFFNPPGAKKIRFD